VHYKSVSFDDNNNLRNDCMPKFVEDNDTKFIQVSIVQRAQCTEAHRLVLLTWQKLVFLARSNCDFRYMSRFDLVSICSIV